VTGLAVPYACTSSPIYRDGALLWEQIAPLAFARSVETGRDRDGRPITAVIGHKRNGRRRKDWIVGSTADGSLRVWHDERGVYFKLAGVALPARFSGCSIMMQVERWRRLGNHRFLMLAGWVRHIALLQSPTQPCYARTKPRTLEMNSGSISETQASCR
jgi:hypothetical protein